MRAFCSFRSLIGVCAMAAGILAVPTAAHAQVPVPCSETALVEAINAANAAGGETLALFPFCTYTLTSAHATGAAGPVGLPPVTAPIDIVGLASTIARAPSAPPFRVLEIDGPSNVAGTDGRLDLTSVTVRGGSASGSSGGGGIANLGGTLSLLSSSITGNTAVAGGGIYTDNGTVSLTASSVTGNTATDFGGGGIYKNSGVVTLSAASVTGNTPDNCAPPGSVPGCTG